MKAYDEALATRNKRKPESVNVGADLFDAPPRHEPPKPDTQCGRIYKFLMQYGSITDEQARKELGIARLAARIYDLANKYHIATECKMITVINRFNEKTSVAKYTLDKGAY